MEHEIRFSDFPQDPQVLAEINGALRALQERGIPSEGLDPACGDAIARLPKHIIFGQTEACSVCPHWNECPLEGDEIYWMEVIPTEEFGLTMGLRSWMIKIQELVASTEDTFAPPASLSVTRQSWGAIVTIHDPDSNLGPEGVDAFAWFLSSRFGLRWITP